MPAIDLSILNQRQTPAFYASSLATRPAFGFAGRIFIDTDSPSTGLYRDTGAAWVQIADPGAGTTGTLQQVTTNGNTTSQGINITAGGLSSNIVTIAANGLGSTANYIGQTMATNDNWKIFGTATTVDQGELVFQVGDNGSSISPNGQKFRFSYDAAATGTSKDVLIIDYDLSYFNTSLGINTPTPGAAVDVHSAVNVIGQLNQTVATNNSLLAFQNSGTGLWRIGNFYNAGANDYGIFDVVGAAQPFTIKKTTGQVLIGTSTVGSGKLVVASTTGDNGIQIVGATAPSLRIDSAESGPTKRIGLGISTATNNFIQGSLDRDFCIFNGSTTASPILFGIYDAGLTNTQEAARISASRNFLIGTTTDAGQKLQVNGAGTFSGGITSTGTNTMLSSSTSTAGLIVYGGSSIGTASSSSGQILIGQTSTYRGSISYDDNAGYLYIDNIYNNNSGNIYFRTKTGGTPVNALTISGNGSATFIGLVSAEQIRLITAPTNALLITPTVDTNASILNVTNAAQSVNWLSVGSNGKVIMNGTGNVLIGTTTDVGHKLQVNGTTRSNAINTNTGSVLAANAVPVTLFSAGTYGMYLVYVDVPAGTGSPSQYSAYAVIVCDGSSAFISTKVDGTRCIITLSGNNVEATQLSGGGPFNIRYVYQLISS
jgi:hypothetical protein